MDWRFWQKFGRRRVIKFSTGIGTFVIAVGHCGRLWRLPVRSVVTPNSVVVMDVRCCTRWSPVVGRCCVVALARLRGRCIAVSIPILLGCITSTSILAITSTGTWTAAGSHTVRHVNCTLNSSCVLLSWHCLRARPFVSTSVDIMLLRRSINSLQSENDHSEIHYKTSLTNSRTSSSRRSKCNDLFSSWQTAHCYGDNCNQNGDFSFTRATTAKSNQSTLYLFFYVIDLPPNTSCDGNHSSLSLSRFKH